MNIILLSGGSGKRLWPLSNEVRSKQFLKIMKNENGEKESMLQRVYRQIEKVGLGNQVTITASHLQEEVIKKQLNDNVSIVLEPERRDTFPAIMLSIAYLYFKKGCSEEEVVSILPVDPYVNTDYFYKLTELEDKIKNGTSDIILMGVKPTYPSAKYGYIIPTRSNVNFSSVLEFKEKPTEVTAGEYIQKGALWNCGVFSFKIKTALNILKQYIEFSSYENIYRQYDKLKKVSFDYEVVEKAKKVGVISYNGEWKDLGTWNTLTETIEDNYQGNIITDSLCSNTHVINELDVPIIALGVKDIVIAASQDGILVSDKEQSSYLKNYTNAIDQRPMFEEKEWGEYKVIDITTDGLGNKTITKRKVIDKGEMIPFQTHEKHSEVLIFLSGECLVNVAGKTFKAKTGDSINISENEIHSIQAISQVNLIEVQIINLK